MDHAKELRFMSSDLQAAMAALGRLGGNYNCSLDVPRGLFPEVNTPAIAAAAV